MQNLPDVKQQRAMLEQKRDGFKREAFNTKMQIEAAKVQKLGSRVNVPVGNGKIQQVSRTEYFKQLEEQMENADLSATRMQEMIDALPKEENTEPME